MCWDGLGQELGPAMLADSVGVLTYVTRRSPPSCCAVSCWITAGRLMRGTSSWRPA